MDASDPRAAGASGRARSGAAVPDGLAPVNPVRSSAKTGRPLLNRWVIGALIGLAVAFPHAPSPANSAGRAGARSVASQGSVDAGVFLSVSSRSVPLGPMAVGAGSGEVIDPRARIAATPPPASLADVGPVLFTLPVARLDQGTVEPVDVNAQSRLVPPEAAVGWYRNEAGLGRPGSALFVAHIAYNGRNGPFRWLDAARVGDEATVGLADGSLHSYVVSSIEVYLKEEVPFDALTGTTGPDRIAIVTCTGSFDKAKRSYDSNLVILAVRHDAAG